MIRGTAYWPPTTKRHRHRWYSDIPSLLPEPEGTGSLQSFRFAWLPGHRRDTGETASKFDRHPAIRQPAWEKAPLRHQREHARLSGRERPTSPFFLRRHGENRPSGKRDKARPASTFRTWGRKGGRRPARPIITRPPASRRLFSEKQSILVS